MKPLQLAIDGFTCYRHEVVIDFRQLDVFVICGATGSGKSSILDAMMYALYGHVPRIGDVGLKELISLRCDRMSIRFDFAVGEQQYRIVRKTPRNSSSPYAVIEQLVDGTYRSRAEGVRQVDRFVAELLGLDARHFKQSVLLPQGEFASFLKETPSRRQTMIREMLHLSIYQNVAAKAKNRHDQCEVAVKKLEESIERDYRNVCPEQIAEGKQKLELQTAQHEKLLAERKRLEAEQQTAREGRKMTVKLLEAQQEQQTLTARQGTIEQLQAALDQADRAVSIKPLYVSLQEKQKQLAQRQTALTQASQSLQTLRTQQEKSAKALAQAKQAAEVLPQLDKQKAQLNRVIPKGEELQRLQSEERKSQKQRDELQQQKTQAESAAQKHAEEEPRLAAAIEQAQAELKSIGYHSEAADALSAQREAVAQLDFQRQQFGKLAEAIKQHEARLKQVRAEQARYEQACQAAEKTLRENTERVLDVTRLFEASWREHTAEHLRVGLAVGEPCPVCMSKVKRLPEKQRSLHFESLEEDVELARQQEGAAKERFTQAQFACQKARHDSQAAEQTWQEARDQHETLEKTITAAEQTLHTALGSVLSEDAALDAALDAAPLEVRFKQALQASDARRKQHEAAVEKLRSAEKASQDQQAARVANQATLQHLQTRLTELSEALERDQKRIAQLRREIADVAKTDDPQSELAAVERQIEQLSTGRDQAQQKHDALAGKLNSAQHETSTAEREQADAQQRVDAAQASLDEAVIQHEFADVGTALAAFLEPDEIGLRREEVNAHRRQQAVVENRIGELTAALGERRVSQEELLAAEKAFEEAEKAERAASQACATLKNEISEAEAKLKRLEKIRQELETFRQKQGLYKQLAEDFRANRFDAYLLGETMQDLAQGASAQLLRLSDGSYSLGYDTKNFFVIDHDNANQTRHADTLSGGETFLASLALAVELSEQVQRVRGAVRLDCLFIDEGFGTLDPDALRRVGDAVRNLQIGGRMVGIITHIPELRDEFDQRILVTKDSHGTEIKLEGV